MPDIKDLVRAIFGIIVVIILIDAFKGDYPETTAAIKKIHKKIAG